MSSSTFAPVKGRQRQWRMPVAGIVPQQQQDLSVYKTVMCSFKFSPHFHLPAPLSFCLFLPDSVSLPLPSSLSVSEVSYPNSSKSSVHTFAGAADSRIFSVGPSPYPNVHAETEKSSQKTVAKLLSVEGLDPNLPHSVRASIDQGLVSRVSYSDRYLMSQSHTRRHRTIQVRLDC